VTAPRHFQTVMPLQEHGIQREGLVANRRPRTAWSIQFRTGSGCRQILAAGPVPPS
jgi:hypothetical protein